MKRIYRFIQTRAARLAKNRLFTEWLEKPAPDARAKLRFLPMALDFIMGFRDFNKYYVTYPEPKNELEQALNSHAAEDATHSVLLLEDWQSLEMDELLGWQPRDMYWWLTCDETKESRKLDFELVSMIYHTPDPLLRFAIIESMEAAGRVFFTRTAPLVEDLAKRDGRAYPYHGKYHLDREDGHLQNTDEGCFLRSKLTAEQHDTAVALVERVFDIFEAHFDAWEKLARDIHEGRWTYSPQEDARRTAIMRPDEPVDVSRFMSLDHPEYVTGVARELADERRGVYDLLWQTPANRWIRQAWPGDFRTMMRYFFLQWIVDNWACADYFTFDTVYPNPSTPLERGINRLSALYASEMNRRYVEWETLQLDDFTGWSVRDALRYYWLDEYVDGHRAVFADLRKLTFRHPQPLHRYWIMKCFVRFGDTLMRSMGEAMHRAHEKDENFITFAGHPERLHPDLPPDPEADDAIAAVETLPLAPDDVTTIREIIAQTRDQEAERSAHTWRVIQQWRFESLHRRWAARPSGPPVPLLVFESAMRVKIAPQTDAEPARQPRKIRQSGDRQ